MKSRSTWPHRIVAAVVTGATMLALTGCQHWKTFYQRPPAEPLGGINDSIWQMQERNAEMSDFVVHLHEFRDHESVLLNFNGEEHLKSIATRLRKGQDAYVIVERSKHTPREDTKYRFPIHDNPELDLRRREMIVRLLGAMGVADADQRTIVGIRLTPGMSGPEAEKSLRGTGGGAGAFGGFFIGGGRF